MFKQMSTGYQITDDFNVKQLSINYFLGSGSDIWNKTHAVPKESTQSLRGDAGNNSKTQGNQTVFFLCLYHRE